MREVSICTEFSCRKSLSNDLHWVFIKANEYRIRVSCIQRRRIILRRLRAQWCSVGAVLHLSAVCREYLMIQIAGSGFAVQPGPRGHRCRVGHRVRFAVGRGKSVVPGSQGQPAVGLELSG
ncbi:hypothetical protein D3C71_1368120 [compost metagenome]